MNLPHWQKLLADRGILEVALEAGWHPDGNGWKYPVATLDDGQVIHRWKAFNSDAKPKYSWPDGKPEQVKYYILPDALETISESGAIYRASGEPDLLTYRAAGIKNVLCWFGEGNIPATVAQDVDAFGAFTVLDYPDRDNTGHSSAFKLAKMLTGVDYHIHQLPDSLGDAGDINKLWVACGFDVDVFRQQLDACPLMDLSDLKPLPDTEPGGDDSEDFPQEFYEAIERALYVEAYEKDGWSKMVPCPLTHHEHDHERPAGAWHQTKHIFYCQKCSANQGTGYVLAKDIAAKLGIDYRQFLKQQPLRTAPKQAPVKSNGRVRGIYSWSEATSKVVHELQGEGETSNREPLPIPFKGIAHFGGLASLMLPKKILAIAGDSGDGKTSLTETLVDSWRKKGFTGAWFSPEWGMEESVYRAIQRAGGPSYMDVVQHRAWIAAGKRGVGKDKRPGAELSREMLSKELELANEIDCWPGKLHIVEQMCINIDEFIALLEQALNEHPEISFVVVDYAQLLGVGSEGVDRALTRFKKFCADHDQVGIVASQVPKEAGKKQASGDRLTHHSLQNARSDYFNLVLTINREILENGERDPFATIYISKNSLGKTGETKLFLNDERLMWFDTTNQTVEL